MEREYESTQAKAGKVLGVDRRTIIDWLGRGAPGKTDNGYDIEALRKWRDENISKTAAEEEFEAAGGVDIQQAITALKLRKLIAEVLDAEAKARLKQFDVTVKTQDVVHMDDVDNWVSGFLTELRRLHLRLIKEMSAGYPANTRKKIQDDLEQRTSLILRSLEGFATRTTEIRDES